MTVVVEKVDTRTRGEYRDLVRACPTALAQQTWEWGRVVAGVGQDEAVFLLARDESGRPVGALPAFYYPNPLGALLISVPQAGGYGGVVVADQDRGPEIYRVLIEALLQVAMEKGCAVTTISTPPFFADDHIYHDYFRPDFARENFYQYIDLKELLPLEPLAGETGRGGTDLGPAVRPAIAHIRRNIRRGIKKALAAGLTVTFDHTPELFEMWYEVHAKRMNELAAAPLPRNLFLGAAEIMFPENLGFFVHVLDGSRVVAGALFIGLNQVLDIFMMSADSEYFDLQPNSLLVYESLRRAQADGYRYYNWQSSSSRESNVYHYKQGWGSLEGRHYYLTRVTGDIGPLKAAGVDRIRAAYRGHYVMPYEALGAPDPE